MPVQKPGRRMPFRNFPAVELPESLAIPTCTDCGEEWFDAEGTQALEQALAEGASKLLSAAGVKALAVLGEHLPQRDLECLLDLSHGYLSKVKHGKEKPSALLVALLVLLSEDPEPRLEELRRLWASETTDRARPRSPARRHSAS